MKPELLLTFTLLAIAAMLWNCDLFTRNQAHSPVELHTRSLATQPGADSASGEQVRFTPIPKLVPPINYPSEDPEIQLMSYQEEPTPLPQTETETDETFQFASYTPAEDEPASLLVLAARNLADSPPIQCQYRTKINMFDQQVYAMGRYFNAGQGSGQTRLDQKIELDDGNALEINQICDGKFFYRIEQLGELRKIEFLDLSEFDPENGGKIPDNPTQWLSRAGTISLLRNLGTAFDFSTPAQETMSGLNVLHLRGQWKPAAIDRILHSKKKHIDPKTGAVNWNRLPNQIPHGVDVYLGNDDFLPLFPYRIVFFQYESKTNLKRAIVTMELYDVEKVPALSPDLFRVRGDDSQQVDLSSAYHQRIKRMVDAASLRESKLKSR